MKTITFTSLLKENHINALFKESLFDRCSRLFRTVHHVSEIVSVSLWNYFSAEPCTFKWQL